MKSLWGDMSRIFENSETSDEAQNDRRVGYRRQIDSENTSTQGSNNDNLAEEKRNKRNKSSKEVHFAFLTDGYESLVEVDDAREQMNTERRIKKKQKYKKYRKNVGKALRFSWKCLVVGLQSFTVGYSTPLSAAASVIPDLHASRSRGRQVTMLYDPFAKQRNVSIKEVGILFPLEEASNAQCFRQTQTLSF